MTEQISPHTLLPLKKVCSLTNLSRSYIYTRLQSGELKAIKVGRRTFVKMDDLHSWIACHSAFTPLKPESAEASHAE